MAARAKPDSWDDRGNDADQAWPIQPGCTGLPEIMEAKLWRNPCWFAARFNLIALRYNAPLYGWVQRTYGLSRPEFVVIYSLGLLDGALATPIACDVPLPGAPGHPAARGIRVELTADPERACLLLVYPGGQRPGRGAH